MLVFILQSVSVKLLDLNSSLVCKFVYPVNFCDTYVTACMSCMVELQ